jgi:hypothetical protein
MHSELFEPNLTRGVRLRHFEVERQIGRGGMGVSAKLETSTFIGPLR